MHCWGSIIGVPLQVEQHFFPVFRTFLKEKDSYLEIPQNFHRDVFVSLFDQRICSFEVAFDFDRFLSRSNIQIRASPEKFLDLYDGLLADLVFVEFGQCVFSLFFFVFLDFLSGCFSFLLIFFVNHLIASISITSVTIPLLGQFLILLPVFDVFREILVKYGCFEKFEEVDDSLGSFTIVQDVRYVQIQDLLDVRNRDFDGAKIIDESVAIHR